MVQKSKGVKTGVKTGLIIAGIIVILIVGWYLASPLFLNEKVNEELPVGSVDGNQSISSISEMVIGMFKDADSFHKVEGSANIITDTDSDVVYLRFEDFKATNGPGLKVYLSNDLNAEDYVSLGDLKGNVGSQNYELEGIDYADYKYILIWCEPFSVLFGYAEVN